jgi:hypothetical protein
MPSIVTIFLNFTLDSLMGQIFAACGFLVSRVSASKRCFKFGLNKFFVFTITANLLGAEIRETEIRQA